MAAPRVYAGRRGRVAQDPAGGLSVFSVDLSLALINFCFKLAFFRAHFATAFHHHHFFFKGVKLEFTYYKILKKIGNNF